MADAPSAPGTPCQAGTGQHRAANPGVGCPIELEARLGQRLGAAISRMLPHL